MADEEGSSFGPGEAHDLNISIRELIYTLRNPNASRLGKFTSSASFLNDVPDKNKYRSVETLTKGWFKQATSLADKVLKLERKLSSSGGQGFKKLEMAYKKLVDEHNDLVNSTKALRKSNLGDHLTGSSASHLAGIGTMNSEMKTRLGKMGRQIGGYNSQNVQNAKDDDKAKKEELARRDAESAQLKAAKNAERSQRNAEKNAERSQRNAFIRNEQDTEWKNREDYFGAKYPSGFSFVPSELSRQKKEYARLQQDFANTKDIGERNAILGNQRENLNAQSQSGYHVSRGNLFNIGGRYVGTSPKEIGGAAVNWGMGALAAAGPMGEVAAGVIKLGVAAARTANAILSIPAGITAFTGKIVGEASPAASVFRQSQEMSIRAGGDRSDYRRWWSLTNKNSIYTHRRGTYFPMTIGPGEMSKITDDMSLSGIGGLASPQQRFATQLNNAYSYSALGGSKAIFPFLKQYARGAPGYNFTGKRAQVPSAMIPLYQLALARSQDPAGFFKSSMSAVATLQHGQTISLGNTGAGFMGLATLMNPHNQQNYDVSSIMPALVQASQNLYRNRFSNTPLATGQMLYLQKKGGLEGMMRSGSPYAHRLRVLQKIHPGLFQRAKNNMWKQMVIMQEATKDSAKGLIYGVKSLNQYGFDPELVASMIQQDTGQSWMRSYEIGQMITKHKGAWLKGDLTKLDKDMNKGIKPGSNMAAAVGGPITQEMQAFNSSLIALNKSRVIVKLGEDIGILDNYVNSFATTIINKILLAIP